jgi:hypothetical protein
MKSRLISGLPAIATLLIAGSALAQTPSERMEQRIDARQARQEQRIDHGVESGSLTQREAARLEHQQAHIDRAESRALADGSLNRREALRMEKMQDRAKRRIRHQKHDRQHAL